MATVFEDLCNFTKLAPEPGEDYEDFAHRVHRKVNTMADADEDLWRNFRSRPKIGITTSFRSSSNVRRCLPRARHPLRIGGSRDGGV